MNVTVGLNILVDLVFGADDHFLRTSILIAGNHKYTSDADSRVVQRFLYEARHRPLSVPLAMLDPLTALSVAGTIIQIVDFGCKLVSQTQEIYSPIRNATKENVTRDDIANDITLLYQELAEKDDCFPRLSADDKALGKLVDDCERAAKDLMLLLANLQVPPDANQWTSFKKAIQSARKEGKVAGLERQLLKIQKQIDSRLQLMMK